MVSEPVKNEDGFWFDDWEIEEDDVRLGKRSESIKIEEEEECHAKLLELGGRPLYDIRKLPEIIEDSNGHFELIRAVQYEKGNEMPYWIDVFIDQLQHFRSYTYDRFEQHRATNEILDEFNKSTEPLQRMVGMIPPFTFLADVEKQDAATGWAEYICYYLKSYSYGKFPLRRFQETRQHWAWYLCWLVDQIPVIQQEMAEAGLKSCQEQEQGVTASTSVVSAPVNEDATATATAALPPAATSTVPAGEGSIDSQVDLVVQEQEKEQEVAAAAIASVSHAPVNKEATTIDVLAPAAAFSGSADEGFINSHNIPAVSAPSKKRTRKRANVAVNPTRRSKRIAASAAACQQPALKVASPETKPVPRRKRKASSSAVNKSKRRSHA